MPLYWSIRYCGARNGKQTMFFRPGTFHGPSDTYSVDRVSRSAKTAGSRKSQARRTATSRELSNGVSFSAIEPPTLLTRSSQNAIDQRNLPAAQDTCDACALKWSSFPRAFQRRRNGPVPSPDAESAPRENPVRVWAGKSKRT